MRRRLIIRFLLAYVLITLCTRVLPGAALILIKGLGTWSSGATPSLQWTLRGFLGYLGQNMASLLLPGTDMSSLVGVFVSASILLGGAVLFARGPVKDYHELCEKAGVLAAEPSMPQGVGNGEPDMERRLEAIAARTADAQAALQARRVDCQSAALLLDAACAQMEVLVEAGSLAEGSAEAGLLQDAISKIRRANSKIIC